MGPGHFGVGFAAKAAAPRAPLWLLLVASEMLDLLSFAFIAVGLETMSVSQTDFSQGYRALTIGSLPWSHGLFMSVVWSIVFGLVAYWIYKDRRTGSIVGFVVFSHWLLDFIVHTPDLPLLFEGSPNVGMGLWGSGPGLVVSIFLELILLAGGIAVYLNARKQKSAQVMGA